MNQRPPAANQAPPVTVTVGNSCGLFQGSDHFAIQAALDWAGRLGGAVVEILPGRYLLRDALRLPSNTILRGHGADTVLRKAAAAETTLVRDAVWYERAIEVSQSTGFTIGTGLVIDSPDDDRERRRVSRHTITAVDGNILHLDRPPGCNHRTGPSTRVQSVHSLVDAIGAQDVAVCDLTLEGNSAANPAIRGDYAAAVYFRNVHRGRMERLAVCDWNGDALSWQTADDIAVTACLIENTSQVAIHPGSGSSRSLVADSRVENADTGIYWCWGVTHSSAVGNVLKNCRFHGMSLGFRDTDITLRSNMFSHCGEAAIYFREEGEDSAHRAVIEENTIDCRPPGAPVGLILCPGVRDVMVRRNKFLVAPGREDSAFPAPPPGCILPGGDNYFNTQA